jgi:hypothetical protein
MELRKPEEIAARLKLAQKSEKWYVFSGLTLLVGVIASIVAVAYETAATSN